MTTPALTPIEFYDTVLLVQSGDTPAVTFVAMRPLVSGMGLDWKSQHVKIVSHPILAPTVVNITTVGEDGRRREMVALPLTRIGFWLATIQPNKIPDPDIRSKVIMFQEQVADIIYAHFFGRSREAPPRPPAETWEADSLSSRIAAVEAARRLYGRAAARDLWPRLGLPEVAPAESPADPAQDRACLDRLLSADLADAAGVLTTVREALAAAWSGDRMMRARLDAAGLRADGGGFWVANRASFLERLFRDTAWAAGGWRFALRRLPGCHGMKHLNNRSIAGMKQRATWVDAALVEHIGT